MLVTLQGTPSGTSREATFFGCHMFAIMRHFHVQEWDYTVLMVADPLARILDLAESVRA